MPDWFDENAPKSEPDWFAKNASTTVVAEPVSTSPKVSEITSNAVEAAIETAKGFIPRSVGDVAKLVTPLASAPEEISKGYHTLSDVLFGGKAMEESARANVPESTILADAAKTPEFSKERFKAGFDILAEMGMAAAIGRGLSPKPSLSETLFPKPAEAAQPGIRVEPEVPTFTEKPAIEIGVEKGPAGGPGPEVQADEVARVLKATPGTDVLAESLSIAETKLSEARDRLSETTDSEKQSELKSAISESEKRLENIRSQITAPAEAATVPPTEAAAPGPKHEWTGATETSAEKGFHLSEKSGRGGATLNPLASAPVSKALKSIEIQKRSQLDEATGERSAKLQQSFADAERAQTEIKEVAPSERRQGAISVWMEANGDQAKLDQWAQSAKGKAFKQAATDAKGLTPEEVAIAQKAQGAFKVLEQRGNQYDVLGNHRDNYVPHVWDVTKKGSGIGSSKLQDQFKFNKARTFQNFFEGDQSGFTPKTLAIGKLLPSYLHEMNKVIADRQFVQDVQGKTAKDGTPLIIPRGRVSSIETDHGGKAYLANPDAFKAAKDKAGNPIDQSKYKVLDQPALHDWRWEGKDANDNPIYMKDDLAVHPDLAKRLNSITGQSAIRQWYNEPSTGLSVIPKAIAKGLDTAQSVMKREMFGLLAPFHQVQEGTHAVGHMVNPFGGIEDMSKPTPKHVDAMKHGLMLLPDRASSGAYMEGVGGKGTFLTQAARWFGNTPKVSEKLVGKASRTLADTVDGYQNYLFHQYIPGLKFKTYEHIQERNMARYSKEIAAGKASEADVKLLSAQQTNAAYGHLNYALLDRNPTMQHILQLGLLAPDFLEARGRFVGQGLKQLVGEKAGAEQFRAIATLAAAQAGIAYTLSKAMGDDWDPKHPFEVVHNGRRYMMRSVPEDLHRLLFQGWDSTREFVSARINPVLQKGVQLETGLNYRGEKTGPVQTMEELFAGYIPITARSIPGLRQLTETSRNNPVSPLEQLAGSLGLKVSRQSPITQVHQLANDWMDKQKIERPGGTYPTSKFQPLRYALEDGDMVRAREEWTKLVGKGGDKKKLSEGFKASVNHPFTGSKQSDEKFAGQLKGKDRMLYRRALQVRQSILSKFDAIH